MSILTMCTSPEWYEAPDLIDEDEDDHPVPPSEALSVSYGRVWWTSALDLDTDD